MGPKRSHPMSAKKDAAMGRAAERRADLHEQRALKEKATQEALAKWVDANDPLLDKAAHEPITVEDLFSSNLVHRSFAMQGVGELPYDWSAFRNVLESRTETSPRWFMQLREEDLLAGEDGMEGVTVDCYVIAEATQPTLAPSEYIVKVHWPYSDAEDNAPERILPLDGQGMCWRRVVKADGSDINAFLLQKRATAAGAHGTATSSAAALPSSAFGFDSAMGRGPSKVGPASSVGFAFGFGDSTSTLPVSAPTPTASARTPSCGFGFGNINQLGAPHPSSAAPGSSATKPSFNFGFGTSTSSASTGSTAVLPATPSFNFGFGAAPTNAPSAPAATQSASTGLLPPPPAAKVDSEAITISPLKTSEVLFALWSRKRLTELAKEIRSGSRIVREDFPLDASTRIKVVMQNDRKDDPVTTARRLILNRLFAKQNRDVKAIDDWINECPVYDGTLTAALQVFRERQLNQLADDSEVFQSLYTRYHAMLEAELQRIIAIRESAADKELQRIDDIMNQIKEKKLAEKSSFRLLKFYAKNDVQKFRPFGKISGISEMGESVDVCVPPAHVNINPFTGKPI